MTDHTTPAAEPETAPEDVPAQAPRVTEHSGGPQRRRGRRVMAQPKGHDMSKFWRMVSVEGGLVTGTWWVSSPDRRGESWVKAVDVVVWHDELHRSGVVMNAGISASVIGGAVDLPRHMVHGRHRDAVWSNLDAVKASILAAVEAVEWPKDGRL